SVTDLIRIFLERHRRVVHLLFSTIASLTLVMCSGSGQETMQPGVSQVMPQAYLKASNTETGDWFGSAVGVSGDTLAIGARQEDSAARGVDGNQSDNAAPDSGAAYVFTRAGDVLTQQAYLKGSNTKAGDRFGYWVDLEGDTLVVGAPLEDNTGTA